MNGIGSNEGVLSILQIPEALKHVRKALYIRNDHVNSLHLLALLLSAQKQNEEALQLIEAAVAEYPDNFKLARSFFYRSSFRETELERTVTVTLRFTP